MQRPSDTGLPKKKRPAQGEDRCCTSEEDPRTMESSLSFSAENCQNVAQGPNAQVTIINCQIYCDQDSAKEDQVSLNYPDTSSQGRPSGPPSISQKCVKSSVSEEIYLNRTKKKITDYCSVTDLESALPCLKLCRVSFSKTTGSTEYFHYCKVDDNKGQKPLLLSRWESVKIWGDVFSMPYGGLEDFPSFQALEADAKSCFDIVQLKEKFEEIRIGESLTLLAGKYQEWFKDSDGKEADFLAYRDIIDNKKEMTENRGKLIKMINGRMIQWLDYDDGDKLCDCGERHLLFQKKTGNFFYGCGNFFKDEKSNCQKRKDLWMSLYQKPR